MDREREIEAFDAVEYWTIGADLSKRPEGRKKASARTSSTPSSFASTASSRSSPTRRTRRGSQPTLMARTTSRATYGSARFSAGRRPRSSPAPCNRTPRAS
ncbi:MAG: hypothetical protein WKH64_10450 [Chloroflexia bacterium]